MSKNQRHRMIRFMAPIALVAMFISQQALAQKNTKIVNSVNPPLTLSLSSSPTTVSA